MDPSLRRRVEIETLHEILDELDYYRLLGLDRDCTQAAISQAFREESRRLHPDRFSAVRDAELQRMANDIYRRVGEAYRVLREPQQRARYDRLLERGVLRMTGERGGGEARRPGDPEHAATHPKAERYWKLALRDWREKNYRGCVMNIQFAMSFEPDNEVFQEWLEKAKAALAEVESKKEKNPYKLRIV